MDDRRFDEFTRAFASRTSRRSLVKSLVGLTGVAALAPFARTDVADAARRPTPTPKPVKCPGVQIWWNGQCTCPTGVACGPDCCATAAQCCDNACCPPGSICFGEEVCCPQSQVCGNACCEPGQDCCSASSPVCIDRSAGGCCTDGDCANLTDACNTGICDPSTNHCVSQPVADGTSCGVCAICQSGNCATCESPLECCQDGFCVDPTNGGCCADAECTGLSDICNTGVCNQGTHRCIAQPVDDGTPCGDCIACVGGVCPPPCESPLLCCDGTTCVDPGNGGCCAAADCPASTDACLRNECQGNQCVGVPAIDCPAGLECLDGACVCAGGVLPCGTGANAECCAIGETCQPISVSGAEFAICCPDGTPACFDPATTAPVCCGGNATCQAITLGSQGSIEFCCEGEVCAGFNGFGCCPSGQVCAQLDAGVVSVGTCCDPGHAACFDGQQMFCCDAGETCTLDLTGSGAGFCCATDVCLDTHKHPVCCGGDSTCQPLDHNGETLDICCVGEPCFELDGDPICCDTGETCQAFTIQGETAHICCAGEACLTTQGIQCCANGDTCSPYGVVSGIELGICCPNGVDACYGTAGTPICCGDDGFTCQPFTIPGVITAEMCCDGPPCVVANNLQCCAVGQICNATQGCISAP